MMSLHDFIDGPYCWDCGYVESSVEGSYACSGVEGVLGPCIGAQQAEAGRDALAARVRELEDRIERALVPMDVVAGWLEPSACARVNLARRILRGEDGR